MGSTIFLTLLIFCAILSDGIGNLSEENISKYYWDFFRPKLVLSLFIFFLRLLGTTFFVNLNIFQIIIFILGNGCF